MNTCNLYSADVKTCREKLLKEQEGLCAITGVPIEKGKAVLEHAHDSEMFVRGVTSRQANSALGVCENMWIRYMGWWYDKTLPEFLRELADYIERHEQHPDTRYRHPAWQKKLKTGFNKLNALQQNEVLIQLGVGSGKNPAERKKLFAKVVLDRSLGYEKIKEKLDGMG